MEGIGQISCGVGEGAGGGEGEPRRARNNNRSLTVAGRALVGEFECCSARSGEEDVCRSIGIKSREARIVRRLNREQLQWPNRDRPATAQRIDGARG